jgi:DNA-directed RNA polymerase subunit A'
MARSFITCDPSLKIDEVGVPRSIAQGIQKPMVVREYNYDECMFYVMNAAKGVYPKASRVYRKATGNIHWLDRHREDQPVEIGDVIYRDIIDGDIVNFNRQPSLEPSSISSMKVVIMEEGKTLRMNVLSCSMFNADGRCVRLATVGVQGSCLLTSLGKACKGRHVLTQRFQTRVNISYNLLV